MGAFIDVVRPENKSLGATFDLLAVLSGSFFLALMAQIAVPLGFTPVPLTMTTFAVMLLSGILGSKRGALACICYVTEAALGFPVLQGGDFGVAKLMGPSAGYIYGFILAAFIVGYLLEKGWRSSYVYSLVAMGVGTLIIWVLGASWLSVFIGAENALHLGVYPFILGDVLKVVLAAGLITSGWKALSYLVPNKES